MTEPPWTPVRCLAEIVESTRLPYVISQELDAILKANKAVKVVIPDWVMESVRAKKLLPERPYFVERKTAK